MSVVGHAIPCRASSVLPYGFSGGRSILTQEVQPVKDIDFTCYKTLPIKTITCLPMGPIFLEWPVALPPECEQSCSSSSQRDSNDEHLENTLPALPHSRWSRDALQPQVQQDTAGRDTCGHFPDGGLRCVTWNTGGSPLGRFFLHKETGNSSSTISGSPLKTTMSSVSRRYTGRMNSSRLFKCGPRDSRYLVRSLLVTRIQEDRPHASTRTCIHKDLLPEDAIVTHVITCQGRDHIVNVQSGRKKSSDRPFRAGAYPEAFT